jgi:hypothetical protein
MEDWRNGWEERRTGRVGLREDNWRINFALVSEDDSDVSDYEEDASISIGEQPQVL